MLPSSITIRPAAKTSGFMLTEVLVAAIVLVAVVSVVAQLAVRTSRLRLDTRHHQVALEELSNQLDRLLAMDEPARTTAIENLAPSQYAESTLSSPEITAQVIEDNDGRRLVVSLLWDRFGKREPVTLVGWLPPGETTEDATS